MTFESSFSSISSLMSKLPSIPPETASYHFLHPPMANRGIHGNLLEVTVIGCTNLKDTEWISRQDPYVCVEYGSYRNRTRVCTDGGKNPVFQEKFVYSLIEGLREMNIIVWNSNTISHDDFIGSGKVQLAKVLSQGFDESFWPLQTKTGRHAGEVRLIMHYSSVNNVENSHPPSSVPPYVTASVPEVSMYSQPPPPSYMSYPPATTGAYPLISPYSSYPPYSGEYHPPPPPSNAPYPPASPGAYPIPSPYFPYPPYSGDYPPTPYPAQASPYLPQPYPPSYPPQPYRPSYPPQPYASQYPHGSAYPPSY